MDRPLKYNFNVFAPPVGQKGTLRILNQKGAIEYKINNVFTTSFELKPRPHIDGIAKVLRVQYEPSALILTIRFYENGDFHSIISRTTNAIDYPI